MTADEWNSIPIHPFREEKDSLQRRGIHSLDSLSSACNYHDSLLLQRALFTFKYKRIPSLAEKLFAFILPLVEEENQMQYTLSAVPLHWRRRFDRGFNQAEFLARRTADSLCLQYQSILKRTRDTGHQAWRTRAERLHAMQGAFALRRAVTLPSHVILIDDIATTGATLDACAFTLKQAGVTRVDAWVIARG